MNPKFYILDYKGGTPGVPVFIGGVVEEYAEQPWNDLLPEAAEVYRQSTPLTLRVTNRGVKFDYAAVHGLFIASTDLLNALRELGVRLLSRPLNVLQKDKRSTKNYVLIRLLDRLWAMDRERSEFRIARDDHGALMPSKVDPDRIGVRAVYKLAISPGAVAGSEMFFCQDSCDIIVSERVAQRIEGFAGVLLSPVDEYAFPLIGEKVVDHG